MRYMMWPLSRISGPTIEGIQDLPFLFFLLVLFLLSKSQRGLDPKYLSDVTRKPLALLHLSALCALLIAEILLFFVLALPLLNTELLLLLVLPLTMTSLPYYGLSSCLVFPHIQGC